MHERERNLVLLFRDYAQTAISRGSGDSVAFGVKVARQRVV